MMHAQIGHVAFGMGLEQATKGKYYHIVETLLKRCLFVHTSWHGFLGKY